jgi:hypothetical protein
MTVEGVQVRLSLEHTRLGDLSIELISPSNTRSVLLHAGTDLDGSKFENTLMLSNHFYGEKAKGDWKLRIIDTNAKDGWSERTYDVTSGEFIDGSVVNLPQRADKYQPNNSQPGKLIGWNIRFYGH